MTLPSATTVRPPGHRRPPRINRLTALTAALFVLATGTGTGLVTGTAQAAGIEAVEIRAPFGEYVDRLSFDVTAIEPALVTAAGPTTLTITGTMTNTGPEELTNLAYRFQRGAALENNAAVRQELAEPSEPIDQVPDDFTPVTPSVPPRGDVPFVFTVSITDAQGLAISAPGVYPLMVNINGAVTLEGGPLEARIGELHLLLTVMGVPGTGRPDPTKPDPNKPVAHPLPVNFVWPLVDRPHLGVGGVFLDEDLIGAISPGGRLATLVNSLTSPAADRVPEGSITVVLDPQLLDELDRMTSAYRVVTPGEPQPSMTEMLQVEGSFAATAQATSPTPTPASPTAASPTPASTTVASTAVASGTGSAPPTSVSAAPSSGATSNSATSNSRTATVAASAAAPTTAAPTTAAPTTAGSTTAADPGSVDIPGTIAGTGQVAAASFLEQLRAVADRYPVLVLPYGDPDVVALVRADLQAEVTTAVTHGTAVADRVLGAGSNSRITPAMAFPINGATDAETLAALQAAGLNTALLSENSIQLDSAGASAAQIALPGGDSATESDTVPAAISQPDVLGGVNALIDQGRQSGWAMRVNALTGVLAQQSFDGSTEGSLNPAIFTPDRRWSPDAPGLRVLTDLLATLSTSAVITATSLDELAASATATAVPAYPEQAQSMELPAEYLDRIRVSRADVASLRETLDSTPQTVDPHLILDPLDLALDAAASTAFRTDPAVGRANLATVEATSAGLRTGVEILSAGNSYTLASSTSPLVLTVQNNLPYDVPVRVEITGGEFVGLTVTDPEVQVVPAGRSQQVKIPAEVSRSGQFQVNAQLVGADGVAWGPPVQLSVESTAYGALTVIIIVVAGGVLVLMVALRIVQRMRGQVDKAPGLAGDPAPTDRP